jgi:fumarate reductase flavoprotein subunit
VEIYKADVVIVGGGGAGLRAAIAVAESDPALRIALVSKVYPMRSHTVAAEGGSAGVKLPTDSLEYHFNDTVGGGDWLCEQDVVEYFVAHCRGIDPARALGLSVEPDAGRSRQCARLSAA